MTTADPCYIIRTKAITLVSQAIKAGLLVRPESCELCGRIPQSVTTKKGDKWYRPSIHAHHWRGYEGDAALDVWFICVSCNIVLQGLRYHSGSVSKEEARAIVLKRESRKEWARRRQQAIRAQIRLSNSGLYPITKQLTY